MVEELKIYQIDYFVPIEKLEDDTYDFNSLQFTTYAIGTSIEDAIKSVQSELRKAEEDVKRNYNLFGEKIEAQIHTMKDIKVPGYKIKLEKIVEETKEQRQEKTKVYPQKENENEGYLDSINQSRFDYDLPSISKSDWREIQAKHMEDEYGYDIES